MRTEAPLFLLFLVLLVLKLTNFITWSWWWITAPLWVPTGLALGLVAGVAIGAGCIWLWEKVTGK